MEEYRIGVAHLAPSRVAQVVGKGDVGLRRHLPCHALQVLLHGIEHLLSERAEHRIGIRCNAQILFQFAERYAYVGGGLLFAHPLHQHQVDARCRALRGVHRNHLQVVHVAVLHVERPYRHVGIDLHVNIRLLHLRVVGLALLVGVVVVVARLLESEGGEHVGQLGLVRRLSLLVGHGVLHLQVDLVDGLAGCTVVRRLDAEVLQVDAERRYALAQHVLGEQRLRSVPGLVEFQLIELADIPLQVFADHQQCLLLDERQPATELRVVPRGLYPRPLGHHLLHQCQLLLFVCLCHNLYKCVL